MAVLPLLADGSCSQSGSCLSTPSSVHATCPQVAKCGTCMAWSPREENRLGRNGGQCMLDRTATQWLDCNAAICPYYHPRLESPAYAQWQAKPAPEQRQQRRQAGKRLTREAPPPSAFALAAAAFQDHPPGVAQAGQDLLAGLLSQESLPVLLERFRGGTVRLVGTASTRELPLEAFFARLALLKSAMNGLDRAIKESPLDGDSKDKTSKDLAGIGGAMTTFNLLFQLKQETFKGTGER